jgi:TolB protein
MLDWHSMGKTVARAGQGFVALLLLLLKLVGRFLLKLWRWLGQVGIVLRRALAVVLYPAWIFLGRLGVAWRNLLTWFIWRPLAWPARRLAAVLALVWRRLGLMGLALRNLLTWFVWRPLLFVTAPARWLYRRWLRRPLAWLGRLLWAGLKWLARQLLGRPAVFALRLFQIQWQATRPSRLRWRRRWRSRQILLDSQIRLWLRRPSPPRQAIRAPRLVLVRPHLLARARPATALLAVAAILAAGVLSSHGREAEEGAPQAAELLPATNVTPTAMADAGNAAQAAPTATAEILRTPWPTPDPLIAGGSMAFSLRQNGNDDIYVLSIGQAEPIRLTNHPAEDRNPAWSPDGRQLAFSSNRAGSRHIYVLDLPTGELRRVSHSNAFDDHPSWSPDGQWLVYESYHQQNLDIYITRASAEGSPIRLTEHPAADYAPAWSPDGRHIAFTSLRSGNKDIFIMSLDAASEEALLNVTASPDRYEDQPAFSPDGRYLAYSDSSTGFDLIYAQPLLNYRPAGPPLPVGQGRYPSWSADGNSLAYVYSAGTRHYLIAATLDAWSVAPQVFGSDGIIGHLNWSPISLAPSHFNHIEKDAGNQKPLFVEDLGDVQPGGAPYLLRRLPVNAPSPYLSDRVDQAFEALRQRVIAETGWDFLGQVDNMYERLDSRPQPGLSKQTWNKAGRAFDFYFRHALATDPQVEVVREDRGNETYWRVYLRTARQDGTQGEPLRDFPWDFRARSGFEPRYYDQGGKQKDALPSGYYVDFTALAADYNWQRVAAAENWRTYFPAIRFWHYQNRQANGRSLTWEEAMLEIYTADEIRSLLEQ